MNYEELHAKLESINQNQKGVLCLEKKRGDISEGKGKRDKGIIDGFLLDQSIERIKEDLLSKARKYASQSNGIATSVIFDMVIKLNDVILEIISKEKDLENIQKAVLKSEFDADNSQLAQEDMSKKRYSGLLEILRSMPGFSKYALGGAQNVEDLRAVISERKKLDSDSINNVSIIVNELKELESNIREQNSWLEKAFEKGFMSKKKHMKKNTNFGEILDKVSVLFVKEVEENNKILRDVYQESCKKGEVSSKIKWLEDKQMKIEGDLELLSRQFIIPKMDFPSGNYVALSCSISAAYEAIKSGELQKAANTGTKKFRIGSLSVPLSYSSFRLNDVDTSNVIKDHQVGFLAPVENVMKENFFIYWEKLSEIRIFSVPEGKEELMGKIKEDIKLFDKMLVDINESGKRWYKEAKELNADFRVNWNVEAKQMIRQDFTKRYVNEQADVFRDKEHTLFDIIDFLTDEQWISNTSQKQRMEIARGDYAPSKIKPKDFREELKRASKQDFLQMVINAKQFYSKILNDAVEFLSSKNHLIGTENAIFLAPRSKVLFWEKFFERTGKRPNVFYYGSEDIRKGVVECFEKCRSNRDFGKVPEARSIYIYNCPSMMLQKL